VRKRILWLSEAKGEVPAEAQGATKPASV
jgi:hypothetical protein